MISVYMPTHNRRILLARAIQSVLEQEYKDFELIVVNDGSTDGTAEYLAEMCRDDQRIRVINNKKSIGACRSRNLAIDAAQGEFVTGLDDDDYFMPNHLSTLHAEYRKRQAHNSDVAVFPGIIIKGENSEKVYSHQKSVVRKDDLLSSNWVGNQILAPLWIFKKAGLFDEQMPAWQDYELWIRVAGISGELYCTGIPTYVQDESHAYGRITQKPYEVIQAAYLRACQKHLDGASERKKFALRINYHSYPQVPMSAKELMEYFRHGLIIKPMYYYLRKKLSLMVK